MRRPPVSRTAAALAMFSLILAACAGGEAGNTTTTTLAALTTAATAPPEATTTTLTATTTTAGAEDLPGSPVTASLGVGAGNTYKVSMADFSALPFEESDLPVAPGSVEIRWYTSGDRYVVAYVGLDLSTTGPLCPGNSIFSTAGIFENVSNAPTAEAACEGFPTLTLDPTVGTRDCNGSVVYVTAIPLDKQGTLYGTLEALADDGTAVIGLTSQAQTGPELPEIDVDAVCA